MRFAVRVEVRRRAGIADPEGRTIEAALPAIGIENVSRVRMGRSIRFVVTASDPEAARAIADAACRRLLANPVLEEYSVDEVVPLSPGGSDRLGEASPLDPVTPEVS
jgi:phosphoribosylformylglycinamidine synthase PurS subunit